MELQIAIARDSYEMYISSCPRNRRDRGIFMKIYACAEVAREERRGKGGGKGGERERLRVGSR